MTAFIGDVHGQYDALSRLLRDAHLVDAHGHWAGGTEQLWFAGDFCDRGPDGVGVLDLVMRLQTEAAAVGGHVGAVLGNHDVVVLGVRRWGDLSSGLYGSFRAAWLANGGQEHDLMRLAGWRSPQMVGRYAASAGAERARDAYRKAALGDRL